MNFKDNNIKEIIFNNNYNPNNNNETQEDLSENINEVNKSNETNEVNEANETNETNEVNEVNEVNENNESNEVNETNETNETNEVLTQPSTEQDETNNQNNDELKIQEYNEEEIPKKKEEFKEIAFKNYSINSNNSNNLENIVFNNNSNKENILDFISGNQNIEIEEEVAIKEEHIIYKDDIVYLKELEQQLLSEYPVTKQGIKFIQKEVEEIAKKIIDVKNVGILNEQMKKNGLEYDLIKNTINDQFNSQFIIPIVLDKHKIYTKLKEEEHLNDNDDSNIYFSESLENKNGVIEENQRVQMINLKNLYHEKALSKIGFKEFVNKETEIITPYITKFNKDNNLIDNIGYLINPKDNTLVLRYYDLKTIQWNTYKIRNDFVVSKDIYDENGKISGIEDSVFIKGEEVNIVGFMILANNNINNQQNFLEKKFKQNGIITKIYGSNNGVIIECNNHGLTQNEIIYINETNSFPRINNTYGKSVKILDENNIEININIKIIKNGDYGILYSLTKLNYDLYKVSKENDIISIDFKETVGVKNEDDLNNKIYLFDDLTINKDDYYTIIKSIFPKLNNIIENNITYLQKSYTFNDVNDIIQKYSININNLNIEQIEIIKNILENNLNKFLLTSQHKKIELKINKNNKKFFKDSDYFLCDQFITSSVIEEVYGKYLHLNKPEDNLILRLKWIESQKDNGKYFYLNYLLYVHNNIKDNLEYSYLDTKIENMEKILKSLEQNFKKEKTIVNKSKKTPLYKYQAYIVSEQDEEENFKNLKKILMDNTVIFYKDNLYLWKDGKKTQFNDLEENTLALVGYEIWYWKEDKWYKSDATPFYDNIKYLCELNNLDLKDVKLDSFDCIYRKDLGCESKIYTRLQESILNVGENLEKIKYLKEYIINNQEIKFITDNIELVKINFFSSIFNKNTLNYLEKKDKEKENIDLAKNNISNNKNQLKINKPDQLTSLIRLINNIQNYDLRLNYIYELIDKDGILIDHNIYSKKYNRKMGLCGHYFYFKQMNYANSPDEKTKIYDNMITLFSDNGETEKNSHTCKICGQFLAINEYDETEGFTESGMIKKSRELWVVEKTVETQENIDLIDYLKTSNLEDKVFKETLLKYGLSIEDVDEAINILIFIIKNLFTKAGVILVNMDLINIIIDSMQKIKNIINYSIYRIKEIKKLQEKGFSKINIEKIDEKNTFRTGYDRYLKIKKNSIICARFLISIQTAIPSVVRSSKSTICPFYSFDEDEGITYMACILDEMNVVLLKNKTKSMELLKASINECYNDFKNLSHIRDLYSKKKIYDIELSKKTESFIFKENEIENSDLVEPVKVGDEFSTIIHSSTNIETIRKLEAVLTNRLLYLAKNIKKVVKDVIALSPLTDIYSGLVESSCCTEDADKFLNYYYYISLESSYPIKNDISESNNIFDFTKYFINIGTIHKFVLYDKNKFAGIENSPIVDDEKHSSENLIKAVFELFVDTGIYTGTLREYVGNINNPVDIKTGLTKNEIMSKIYSIDSYQQLLQAIEKNNIKYYTPHKKIFFEKDILDKLKKDSDNLLDKEINNLVKNISTVLNKDKDFIQKYIDLIRNFGILNDKKNNSDNDLSNDKDRIKKRESMNKKRLDYIKKFYITKVKKYLSIIKNGNNKSEMDFNLSFTNSDEIALELQTNIFTENRKLLLFFNKDIQKYFMDLNMQYTNEEINSINGIDNIYDSSYEKIKVYSDFNFNDASNVLLHILISQLNQFILCVSNSEEQNNDVLDFKNIKCKYICEFIMILLNDLNEDNELYNLCEHGVEQIKNSLIHENIEYKKKAYFKDEDFVSRMLRTKLSKQSMAVDDLEEKIDEEYDESDLQSEDKLNMIMDKGKEYLTEKLGYVPTEDQLESYKEDYMKNLEDDIMYEEEAYDLNSTAKGQDVIDQGAEYGEFNEYDFETGDGFDYSAQEEEY